MTKRIIAASTIILLGAIAAAPAHARPRDASWHQTYDNWAAERFADQDDDDDRPVRRSRRARASQHAHRHAADRDDSDRPRARRRYADGASASRGCLKPAARALLHRIESRFGHIQIVSTCRPGAVIAGSGRRSKHATGEAIDFNAPRGHKAEVVRWLIANHKNGGTMTYAGMGHIHVDIGYHFVALNSHSGG